MTTPHNEQDKYVVIDRCEKSYEYNEEDRKVVSLNNTVASLDESWRKLKEHASGKSYDIGVGLCAVGNKLKKTYNNITQALSGFLCNFYGKTEEKKAEETEMEEFISLKTKRDGFINDGWEIVDHDDCPSPEEKFDMNKGKIVENEQPRTNLSIAGKVSDFIGRFLG
ncbi:hypothetical protein [Wolbachia endosymbiont (group E) of Neria commutata]|uniref:hypothetical protein n=1 Tax=Wolbachia endosymbiont (group E) of Neria commutata TaxID=3066149 RepID=UPI003132FA81